MISINKTKINKAIADFLKQIPNITIIDLTAYPIKVTSDLGNNAEMLPYYDLAYFVWMDFNKQVIPLMITVNYQWSEQKQEYHYVIKAEQLYIRSNRIINLQQIFGKDDTKIDQYLHSGTAQYHSSNYLDYVDPNMMALLHYIQVETKPVILTVAPIKQAELKDLDLDLQDNVAKRIIKTSLQKADTILEKLPYDTSCATDDLFLDHLVEALATLNKDAPIAPSEIDLDLLKQNLYINPVEKVRFSIFYQINTVALDVLFGKDNMVSFCPSNDKYVATTIKLKNSIFALIDQLDKRAKTKTYKCIPLSINQK